MNEQIPQTAATELPSFSSSKREGLCALLVYIPAYLCAYFYVSDFTKSWHLAVIAAFLILITELLHSHCSRSAESWVWLGCFLLCTVSGVFNLGSIWSTEQCHFFVHIFAVWWILSRSGKLLEGESGHLLPLDAFNAFLRVPFTRFFLRIRSLIYNVRHLLPERDAEARKRNLWIPFAAVLCLALFILSASLLMRADTTFGDFFRDFSDLFHIELDGETVLYFFVSLPVGAWLFGLMAGTARLPQETLDGERDQTNRFLRYIRKVPVGLWIGVTALFSALYLAFFVLQGSYLFGAFTRTLPEGFIVSQYAREGFFELCKVMAVNFTLLWLVTRMASADASHSRAFRTACLILLLESMLFAVVAFSKLYLYISCFGFTPKRLQSAWLVCVLFAGCVLWSYTLLTEKPAFRKWMFFGAVSLSVLTLI